MLSIAGRKMRRLRSLLCVSGVEQGGVGAVVVRPRPQNAAVSAAVHAVECRRRRRRRVPTTGTSIRRRDVAARAEARERKLESGGAWRSGDARMMSVQHHRRRAAVVKTAARPARPLYARLAGSGVDHVTGSGAARRPVGAAEAVGGMLEVAGAGVVLVEIAGRLVVLLMVIGRRQSAVRLAVEVAQRVRRVGMHHSRRGRSECFIIIIVRRPLARRRPTVAALDADEIYTTP